MLDAIGQTRDGYYPTSGAYYRYALRALGQAAQALASRLDADRGGRAFNRVLDAIGQTMDADQLQALGRRPRRWRRQARGWMPTAADARSTACWTPSARPWMPFSSRRSGRRPRRWRRGWMPTAPAARSTTGVLDAIGQTMDADQLQALGQAAQALAQAGARLDADRGGRALDRVLDAIGQTMDATVQLQALGQAAQALAQAGAGCGSLAAARSTACWTPSARPWMPFKLQALGQAAQALASRLDADRAGRALDGVLDAIGQTMDADQLQALGRRPRRWRRGWMPTALAACWTPSARRGMPIGSGRSGRRPRRWRRGWMPTALAARSTGC